jgi:hypothetical protein
MIGGFESFPLSEVPGVEDRLSDLGLCRARQIPILVHTKYVNKKF